MHRSFKFVFAIAFITQASSLQAQDSPTSLAGIRAADYGGFAAELTRTRQYVPTALPVVPQNPSACPTMLLAEFPDGAGNTLCMWEISDCGTNPPTPMGSVYAACSGAACNCPNCEPGSGTVMPPIEVNEGVPGGGVEDDPPPGGGGEDPPAGGGGDNPPAGNDPPEGAVMLSPDMPLGRSVLLTSLPQPPGQGKAIGQGKGKKKLFRSNKKKITFAAPVSTRLVPAAANEIMPNFGKNGYAVKYLKSLSLDCGGPAKDYFALYKVFKKTATNADGAAEEATDHYVGVRMTLRNPQTPPPGGLEAINTATQPKRLTKLGKCDSGFVREAAVEVNVGAGKKIWFHLFGTVL